MPQKRIIREVETSFGDIKAEIIVSVPCGGDYFRVHEINIISDHDRGNTDAIFDELDVAIHGRLADSIFDEASERTLYVATEASEVRTTRFGSPVENALTARAAEIQKSTGCSALDALERAREEMA